MIRTAFTRHIYLPLSSFLQGERPFRALRSLERSQWNEPERLLENQFQLLRAALMEASSSVRFYEQRFAEVELDPRALSSLEDFRRIPILTKDQARDRFNELLQPEPRPHETRAQSSGSTGRPVRIVKGPGFRSYHTAAQWRARAWYGVRPGDRALVLWGRPIHSWKARLTVGLKSFLNNMVHVSLFELNEERLERIVSTIPRMRPRWIRGYPSGLYELARVAKRKGMCLRNVGVRMIESTAETLYDFQRELLVEVFGCPVMNVYGCAEFGAFAHLCPSGRMHISCENVLVEFLRDGCPVGPGESGTTAVTDLRNPYMPLIRYEVGDIGVPLSEACPCGRGLPVMDIRSGKIGQMVRTASGRLFSEELFSYMPRARLARKGRSEIEQFLVIQTALDAFTVKIVAREGNISEALKEFEAGLRTVLDETISVDFELVESLPRHPGGKLTFFESRIESSPDGR